MDARRLEEIGQPPPALLRIRMDMSALQSDTLDQLKELFVGRPGSCPVCFELIAAGGEVVTLKADQRVRPDHTLVESVRELCGPDAVRLEAHA